MCVNKISSPSNPKIKYFTRLQKSGQWRAKEKLFVIEGDKEVSFAHEAGYTFKDVFICRSLFKNEALEEKLLHTSPTARFFEVSKQVYEKMAYRGSSHGIAAIAEIQTKNLDSLTLMPTPFLLVLKDIEKPGNIGAILRTADAAAVDAVIICGKACDIYNPNVIRASVGTVFFKQIVQADSNTVWQWLKSKGVKIAATSLKATVTYNEADYSSGCALVLGSEESGLSDFWLKNADELIKIPMLGKNDSLNVSTAAAVITYEVVRQRRTIKKT